VTETLLIVALIALAIYVLQHRLLGGTKVGANIVAEKINAGAAIIDVRSVEEFRDGAYPGARCIPLQELGRRLGEIPKDKPAVLYCASGARSAAAARLLRQQGYTDVVNAGGLADMPPARSPV
jgi:phage shock protein E